MGLGLTADDVAALEGRTEGWIAALQLAGLSMQGRDDVAGFIADFAGDDRYIVDYLVEEVLQRQPEEVRSFLLQTSILARMSGPLCDAVTGQDGGQATLEALDRRNLFLIPLDDRRRWYRYHHLFADVLQARLLDERPELVPELHRRATEWYAQEGERAEAIRHAIAGGDFRAAADLVELAIPAMRRARQESRPRRWLEALPDELIRVRPVLSDATRGAPRAWRDRGRRGGACRTPSAGWPRRAMGPAAGDGRRGRGRHSATCRPRSPSTVPGWPGSSATSPARWPTPDERSTSSARTTSRTGRRRRAAGPRLLGGRGSRGRVPLVRRGHASLEKAGHLADLLGLRHHPGRHPDRAGPAERRDAQVRAGPGRSRPATASRPRAARRTCTSG